MSAKKRARRVARRLFRLCIVDRSLDEALVRQVAAHLGASGRRGAVHVLTEFQRLVRLDLDRRAALVESAAELPREVRDLVRAELTGRFGSGVHTTFVVEPALIAGLRITVGSEVLDGSLRARLATLEAHP